MTELFKDTLVRACAYLVIAAVPCIGQPTEQPIPVFTREAISANGRSAKVLAPGMVMSLYGGHLAPEAAGCGQPKVQPALEVCGVRVLIDTTPAELLFVSSGQVNFKIPAGVPTDGFAPLRVCIGAVCSAPVRMWFSTRTALLSLEKPAYVHMPVWIHVDAPPPHFVAYPCWNGLRIPRGYEFEVRQDGKLFPALPQPAPSLNWPSGEPCDGPTARNFLPLHLLYRFDQPGKYSVRFTFQRENQILYRSEWTDIVVEPFSEEYRQTWLNSVDLETKMNSRSIVSDTIPSLLAWPDERALDALLRIIPANATQCINFDCMKLVFGRAALGWFDAALLRNKVPPERLRALCPPDGRCG